MAKTNKRDAFTASLVRETANMAGVSARQVRRVINGTSENDNVMSIYMELKEGSNKLLTAIKLAVPFDDSKELVIAYQ